METEKIDVPKFDGFESFYGKPIDHDDCWVLSGIENHITAKEDVCDEYKESLEWYQICYRKIKPRRFIFDTTGEFRPPKSGEYYVSPMGNIDRASDDYVTPREICRLVEGQS